MQIIDHDHPIYRKRWGGLGTDRFNGAYYYSREIVENIIPRVRTDRNWITMNIRGVGIDHSIMFVHNNKRPRSYDWLKRYDDLILVCGVPHTAEMVRHLGRSIYLPLSVDVEYVKQFKRRRTKDTAFVGRLSKATYGTLPDGIEYLHSMERDDLLAEMAKYKRVYAVGRTAIEAKILGAEVLPYDSRFPDPRVWKVIDNSEAAVILQQKLDKIEQEAEGGYQWLYDPKDFEI